ncbi:MAG: DUF6933 domain-containing protein [Roseburia sp.]
MYIFCSKALAEALNIKKTELLKISADTQVDDLYAWHGHISKLNGRNTIVLMNDKTMYSSIFRNKLPRNAEKFAELIKEAISYTMEVGGFNNPEIDKYMAGIGEIVFYEKPDRQMTGNLNRMFLDMEYTGYRWFEDESIQAEQAAFENNGIRKQGKEYVKPFERMLEEIEKLDFRVKKWKEIL